MISAEEVITRSKQITELGVEIQKPMRCNLNIVQRQRKQRRWLRS